MRLLINYQIVYKYKITSNNSEIPFKFNKGELETIDEDAGGLDDDTAISEIILKKKFDKMPKLPTAK